MTIATVVSGYNLVFGLMFCVFVTKRIGGQLGDMFVPMLSTFAFGSLALILTAILTHVASINNANVWQALGLVVVYSTIYIGLTRFFLKDSMAEIVSLVRLQISSSGLTKGITQ